jgi:copper chaperone CopZ
VALVVAVVCVSALAADNTHGASPQKTVITVGEMCNGCVQRITTRLKRLPEVSTVKCNLATRTVTVAPKAGQSLSPRTLWQAMAGIGMTPKKLVGPAGTFTSKPKQ